MKDTDSARGLLTLGDVARRLDMAREHVARLTRAGRLPATETPLGRLYAEHDVDRFAVEQRQRATRDRRIRVPAD